MKSIYIHISDLIIELICRHHDYIEYLCKDFLVSNRPEHVDISVEVSKDELNTLSDVPGGFMVPEGNREFYKLHTLLRRKILAHDCLILHGTAIRIDQYGIVFTASTGTGKSTHADLWKDVLGSRVSIINDDWPIVRIKKGKAYLDSSPWCGYRRINEIISVPLKCIFQIERSDVPQVLNMNDSEALSVLLKRSCTLCQTISQEEKLYVLIEDIIRTVRFKKAKITLGPESVYELLSRISL